MAGWLRGYGLYAQMESAADMIENDKNMQETMHICITMRIVGCRYGLTEMHDGVDGISDGQAMPAKVF